jgi:hypothetical protein
MDNATSLEGSDAMMTDTPFNHLCLPSEVKDDRIGSQFNQFSQRDRHTVEHRVNWLIRNVEDAL